MNLNLFRSRKAPAINDTGPIRKPGALRDVAAENSALIHNFNSLPEKVRFVLSMPIAYFEEMRPNIASPDDAPPLTNVVFILDRSESMAKSKEATVAGFNEQVRIVREGARYAGETTFTEVQFNSTVQLRSVWTSLDELEPLSHLAYALDGMTALYDALGEAIDILLGTPRIFSPNTGTLVILFTDGMENASSRYSANVLEQLIKRLEASGHWTFALVGSKGSVSSLGTLLSIRPDNVVECDSHGPLGPQEAFNATSRATTTFMNARVMGVTHVDSLFPRADIFASQNLNSPIEKVRPPTEEGEPAPWISADTMMDARGETALPIDSSPISGEAAHSQIPAAADTQEESNLLDEDLQRPGRLPSAFYGYLADLSARKEVLEAYGLVPATEAPAKFVPSREVQLRHLEERLAIDGMGPRSASTSFVYKNIYANGKIFIGVEAPWNDEARSRKAFLSAQSPIENYKTREILWESGMADPDKLSRIQREWIARFRSDDPKLGYNTCS